MTKSTNILFFEELRECLVICEKVIPYIHYFAPDLRGCKIIATRIKGILYTEKLDGFFIFITGHSITLIESKKSSDHRSQNPWKATITRSQSCKCVLKQLLCAWCPWSGWRWASWRRRSGSCSWIPGCQSLLCSSPSQHMRQHLNKTFFKSRNRSEKNCT